MSDAHADDVSSQMKESERDVQQLVLAFNDLLNLSVCDEKSIDNVYCLSSGIADPVVTGDLLHYVSTGREAVERKICQRMASERNCGVQ